MGLLDFLTSTKRPASGTPVLPAQAVREKLMALNRPTAPFHLIDGASEGVDADGVHRIVVGCHVTSPFCAYVCGVRDKLRALASLSARTHNFVA